MKTPRFPLPVRRSVGSVRRVCQSLGMAAGLAGLLVGLAELAQPVRCARAATTATTPAPLSLEVLTAQATRQKEELQRLEEAQQTARKVQLQGEQAAALRSQEIEKLKSQSAGVGRDLRLQELLAQAQEQAVLLSQQAGELRLREAAVRSGRERLLTTCDQLLAADSGGKLPLAQRLSWLRLRTAQVEALHGTADRASLGQAVRTAVQAGSAPESNPDAAVIDDPRLLRERADLLRDSADKLRREVQRLKLRGEELGRRQRLRERAARVDEDLFAEQTTSRHLTSPSGSSRESAATLAAPTAPGAPPPGPAGVTYDSAGGGISGSVRSTLDPFTLDILQRAESLTDPVAKLQAIQRAQSELTTLTDQLLTRATRLERRATELSSQK